MKPRLDEKQQKIQTIKDLLAGRIKPSEIDDKIEVFREDGKEVAFKVNNKFVEREAWLLAFLNNPKNPNHIGTIIVHSDEERYNGPLPDEYYV